MSLFARVAVSKTAFLLAAVALAPGCAPVFSEFQDARLVGLRKVEITPSASTVSESDSGETTHIGNVYGVQLGIGLGPRFDLRVAYARLQDAEDGPGANVVGFGPKVGIIRDRLALYVPLGTAFGETAEASDNWQMHPTVLATIPFAARIDFNPSLKLLVPLSRGTPEFAFNLGFGLSPLSRRWTVRPEVGFLLESGHSFSALGVGFSYFPDR
jgi:hypothetical protein